VPLTEDSELRRDRYPYRGSGRSEVPDDYEKLDVEERWLARGAVALRGPTRTSAPTTPPSPRRCE
jgi:hypothetical protein